MNVIAAAAATRRTRTPIVPKSGERARNMDAACQVQILEWNRHGRPGTAGNNGGAPSRPVLFNQRNFDCLVCSPDSAQFDGERIRSCRLGLPSSDDIADKERRGVSRGRVFSQVRQRQAQRRLICALPGHNLEERCPVLLARAHERQA